MEGVYSLASSVTEGECVFTPPSPGTELPFCQQNHFIHNIHTLWRDNLLTNVDKKNPPFYPPKKAGIIFPFMEYILEEDVILHIPGG